MIHVNDVGDWWQAVLDACDANSEQMKLLSQNVRLSIEQGEDAMREMLRRPGGARTEPPPLCHGSRAHFT